MNIKYKVRRVVRLGTGNVHTKILGSYSDVKDAIKKCSDMSLSGIGARYEIVVEYNDIDF